MNQINCRVKLNDHHIGLVENVTPAEVIVLRHIHDLGAGGNCIVQAVRAGAALMSIPGANGEPTTIRGRSSAEEYARLRKKYPARSSPDKPNSTFLDDLFPGVKTGAQELPTSFEALPPELRPCEIKAAPAKFVRTLDATEPMPVNEEEAAAILAEQAKRKGVPEPAVVGAAGDPGADDSKEDLSGPLRPQARRAKAA